MRNHKYGPKGVEWVAKVRGNERRGGRKARYCRSRKVAAGEDERLNKDSS